MIQHKDSYQITLTQRLPSDLKSHTSEFGFRDLKRDFKAIYENFSLLSYFSPSCQITILDRFRLQSDKNVEVDYFKIGESESQSVIAVQNQNLQYYLFQKSKDPFPKGHDFNSFQLSISYTIGSKPDQISSQNPIQVCFKTQHRYDRQYIHITISDKQSWIQKVLNDKINQFPTHRFSERTKMYDNQLQYFYKQPLSKRNKKYDGKHFSIALQGGGVKGVAYIGAYKALKMEQPDIPIKSIIGSSAGGMLGCAICCQMTIKQMIQLCKQQLSHLTDDQRYDQIDQTEAIDKMKIIKQFLLKYGVLHTDVVDLITDIITDPAFQKAVLKFLQAYNPQIKKLFVVGDNKLSMRGLLEGALMSGNSIRDFAKTCLLTLRKQEEQTDYQDWEKNMQIQRSKMKKRARCIKPSLSNQEWAETLTFTELYQITGTQFTCTSVDVMSHILRFFNHKTTPDMPVCKAVQMTGSFPVAFESQKWDTQKWGKYYIHYDNIRRQVDLDGHQFTDGGVLANFPIKYLDNQYMRPMYFSHAKIDKSQFEDNYTIIYGFGLNAIKPPQDLSKASEQFSAQLQRIAMSHISYWDMAKIVAKASVSGLTKSNIRVTNVTENQNPITLIKKVPVIQFVSKLINTYIKTKDNLTEECFAHRIFQTQIGKSYEKMILKKNNIKEFSGSVEQLLKKFKIYLDTVVRDDNEQNIFQQCLNNVDQVISILQSKQPYSEKILLQITTVLQSSLANLSITQILLQHKNDSKMYKLQGPQIREEFKREILDLGVISQNKVFVYSEIVEDYKKLIQIATKLKKWLQNMAKITSGNIYNFFKMIRTDQYSKLCAAYHKLEKYYQQLNARQIQVEIFPMDQETAYCLYQTKKWCLTSSYIENLKFQRCIQESGIPQLQIGYHSYKSQQQINSYVTQLLSQKQKRVPQKSKKAQGVHIILQSISFSELYYNEYLSVVQNSIVNYNLQRKKQLESIGKQDEYEGIRITSMTASNFHSLVMFLYASDLPINQINQKVWKIQYLKNFSDILYRKTFTKEDWNQISKSNALKMKQVEEKAWNDRQDIYKEVERMMQAAYSNQNQDLNSDIKQMNYRSRQSADRINSAIESSLNYVIDELMTIQQNDLKKDNIEKVCQKMAINIQGHQNQSLASQKCTQKVYLMKMFSGRFLDLIKFFFYSSNYVKQLVLTNISYKQLQKQAWKALLSEGILRLYELKKFICQILEKIGLNSSATLSEFYQFTRSKIHLNYAVIQNRQQRIRFYNHKTRPNMPVWAAILSTCCLSDFYKAIPDRNQWDYRPSRDQNTRLIKDYFKNKSQATNFLTSAEIITKMPMELLTNEKLRKKITQTPNQVYLGFNFTSVQFKPINTEIIPKIQSAALTLWNLYRQKSHLSFLSTLFDLPGLQSLMNRLSTYSNSHDNLITGLYKKQLAKLPIRVETLDFDKILNEEGNDISPLVQDSIMQCEYVIKEKIQNTDSIGKREHTMYFALQSGSHKNKIVFRHLSAFNPTQSLFEKYKLFYRIGEVEDRKNFIQFSKQRLQVQFKNKSTIHFRFEFPQKNKKGAYIRKIRYHSIDMQNLIDIDKQFKLVYKIPFDEFYEEFQKIQPESPMIGYNTNIRYQSFLMVDSVPKQKLVCDVCNNSDDWKIIQLQELKKIQGMTQKQRIQHKFQCARKNCPSRIGNYQKDKDMFVKLQYQCQNCKHCYCAYCKYRIYIDEHQNLKCSLKHDLKKTFHHEDSNSQKIKFIQCSLCEGFHSNYFMSDPKCQVYICESCTILKLFKKKKQY